MFQEKARTSGTSGTSGKKKSQMTETLPAPQELKISEISEPSAPSASTFSTSSTRRNVDVDSMIERYGIRLPKDYEESATTSSQATHFAEELAEEIPETLEELRAGMRKTIPNRTLYTGLCICIMHNVYYCASESSIFPDCIYLWYIHCKPELRKIFLIKFDILIISELGKNLVYLFRLGNLVY